MIQVTVSTYWGVTREPLYVQYSVILAADHTHHVSSCAMKAAVLYLRLRRLFRCKPTVPGRRLEGSNDSFGISHDSALNLTLCRQPVISARAEWSVYSPAFGGMDITFTWKAIRFWQKSKQNTFHAQDGFGKFELPHVPSGIWPRQPGHLQTWQPLQSSGSLQCSSEPCASEKQLLKSVLKGWPSWQKCSRCLRWSPIPYSTSQA